MNRRRAKAAHYRRLSPNRARSAWFTSLIIKSIRRAVDETVAAVVARAREQLRNPHGIVELL